MSASGWNRSAFFAGKNWLLTFILIAALTALCTQAVAQSTTAGDIAGVVTDPSGAVVPKAKVTVKSLENGSTQSTTTNESGYYRVSLLKPGRYSVSAGLTGFQTSERQVDVGVGAVVTADIALTVGQATQTVEVTETAALMNPEASSNTSFSPREVQNLPSAGGDITNIAFTAPGVVVNSTGGYGNFTVNGMPATSNLFTVNGENDMDPYFNINNSGATNLTLGQNDLQEATVITNAYSGQYGTLAGAQVNYVTRSGSNQFHGNAQYWWNGRYMNANDWFNNFYGTPRPFANANQWASGIGGPIRKNKTFFFFNTEGLHFVLPNVDVVTIPSAAFAGAVLANVTAKHPAEASAYQKMFSLYANAPGASNAVPLANSSACSSLSLPGFNPSTQNCADRYEATPTALAKEWIISGRVDHQIGANDNAYYRYRLDHGLQPTTLDPINSAFDALSNQPAWDNQFKETHIFGPRSTNEFLAAVSHYVAQFSQNEQLATSTFPYQITTSGTVPFNSFNALGSFPQGRNITQYQFVDDFTIIRGKHDLKFGVNFRRYDVSDHNFFFNNPAVYFGYTTNGLQNYADGLAYQYRKSLNTASDVPVALWGMGIYANDDWHIKSNLKITLGLRLERNSNPVCQFSCFANFNTAFSNLPSVTSSNPSSVPYSSDIAINQKQAFQGVDPVDISPRLGFSWSPMKDNKTVISGGAGIFYDSPAAGLVDDLLANPPAAVAIRVRPAAGVLGFDPAGGAATWQASANAFSITKTYTQISQQLAALGSVFAAPAFTTIAGTVHAPISYQWNFQIQRQLSHTVVLTANYVGHHDLRILYTNNWPNAFDQYQIFPGVPGVPAVAKVPNYGQVTTVQNGAIANYDGLNLTVRKQFSHGVVAHFNYTWSHALDEVSNGGLFTYGDSLLGQINPTSLRANNYGNADYDIRHNFSADWVYTPSVHLGNKVLNEVVGGWQWAGKAFWRSGLPFSIIDGNWNGGLGNGGGTILATYTGGQVQTSCGAAAAVTPCLNAGAFLNSGDPNFNNFTAWSNQNRNQFRGPGYFDMDMSLFRTFKIREGMSLAVGLQAFNVFNHPNFANPDNNLGDSTFGNVQSMAGTPTSAYGSFLGFDSSPRVAQLTGKFVF
jgi:hypothetical protein